jgi:ABC-type amino acid transport system permease subunit
MAISALCRLSSARWFPRFWPWLWRFLWRLVWPSFSPKCAPGFLRAPLAFVTELLAAIPSVIYGMWAVFVLVPLLREHVNPLLIGVLGWTGFFKNDNPTGLGFVAAGVILAVMILPIISSLTREVMNAVPGSQREAVLALGATRWEMIRMGVLRNARIGIVGAIILGPGQGAGRDHGRDHGDWQYAADAALAAGQWSFDGLGHRQ